MRRREFIAGLGTAATRRALATTRPDAASRRTLCTHCRRSRGQGPRGGISGGPTRIRLDRRPQCATQRPLVRGRWRAHTQERRRLSRACAGRDPRGWQLVDRSTVKATRAVPVVFVTAADPVAAGFVNSRHARAATLPAFSRSTTASAQNGLSFLKKFHQVSRGLGSSGILQLLLRSVNLP